MQGKILADGLIGGNDGQRYTFKARDLKNASGESIDALIGCEVDFMGENGKASEIYITQQAKTLGKDKFKSALHNVDNALSNFDADKAKNKIKGALSFAGIEGLARIQKRTYAMVVCFVIGSIVPLLGFFFKIAAFVFGILATKELCQISQSKALLKKFIVLFVLVWIICMASPFGSSNVQLVGNYGRGMPSMTGMLGATMGNAFLLGAGLGEQAFRIIAIILIIPTFFILRAYTRELVFITQQSYFNFVLYLGTIALLPLPFVSKILSLIALGFYVIAWVRTQEIHKSYSATS